MTEELLLKDKIIKDNDVELVFRKDSFWPYYDENQLPSVKYILKNCEDVNSIKFEEMDQYNDGVMVETRKENGKSVFETTDLGGIKVKIMCDKIEKEESTHSYQDLVDLIKEISRQRDNEHTNSVIVSDRLADLEQFLSRELDLIARKTTQADWLPESKKQFLLGQQEIIKRMLNIIDTKYRT